SLHFEHSAFLEGPEESLACVEGPREEMGVVEAPREAASMEDNNTRKGMTEDNGLKTLSWKRVAKVLKDNHSFVVDQKQMKYHYDYLKTKYTAWLSLRNKIDNTYDQSTNTFQLSEEE
ncbi:Myb/SANT-like domain-containing protein, partial [Tanacetum coccineum]